jgi:hypothetical protein
MNDWLALHIDFVRAAIGAMTTGGGESIRLVGPPCQGGLMIGGDWRA